MYRLSRGQLRLWGAPAVACPARFTDINLAGAQQAESLRIGSRYEGALVDLRRLARDDCKVAAWLRFARAPGLVEGDAVDLRFAATPRGNFTSLPIAELKNSACPVDVPQWAYPRADLLTPGIQ